MAGLIDEMDRVGTVRLGLIVLVILFLFVAWKLWASGPMRHKHVPYARLRHHFDSFLDRTTVGSILIVEHPELPRFVQVVKEEAGGGELVLFGSNIVSGSGRSPSGRCRPAMIPSVECSRCVHWPMTRSQCGTPSRSR